MLQVLRVEDRMDCHCLALFKSFDEQLPSKFPTDSGPHPSVRVCVCVCLCERTCVLNSAFEWLRCSKGRGRVSFLQGPRSIRLPFLKVSWWPFCSVWWQIRSFQIVINPFSSFKQLSRAAVLAFGCWPHQSLNFCYFAHLWWFFLRSSVFIGFPLSSPLSVLGWCYLFTRASLAIQPSEEKAISSLLWPGCPSG